MSYIACDTDGNCRITDDEAPAPETAGADNLIGEDVSRDKEEHVGEIREIMTDKYGAQVSDAALSHSM